MARRATASWWALGGSERCPCCLQLYAYEVQVRCTVCDGPLCPLCAVELRRESRLHRCPGCAAEAPGPSAMPPGPAPEAG